MDVSHPSQAFIQCDNGISHLESPRNEENTRQRNACRRGIDSNAKQDVRTAGETGTEPRRLKEAGEGSSLPVCNRHE
ncbi:hypothetical protein DPMN_000812 [Dreissena polymorpha]|uniref:Uncharacterized protein n=1 Tax=Dreissena polymorpha TaxID=45954 RepID=A0A9D4RQA3_DREPO|nr:hypothetical protein DPMN_000812 [Dreissena polymorpha]